MSDTPEQVDDTPRDEMLSVRDVLKAYCAAHGYEGLAGDGCGCDFANLAPCDSLNVDECRPAYRQQCDETCPRRGTDDCYTGEPDDTEFCMCLEKPKEADND